MLSGSALPWPWKPPPQCGAGHTCDVGVHKGRARGHTWDVGVHKGRARGHSRRWSRAALPATCLALSWIPKQALLPTPATCLALGWIRGRMPKQALLPTPVTAVTRRAPQRACYALEQRSGDAQGARDRSSLERRRFH